MSSCVGGNRRLMPSAAFRVIYEYTVHTSNVLEVGVGTEVKGIL